ncbi:nicotinamide riboside transporter PnuC [bacterium]|nr:MAG: nicotinamide riboside transporter PnuC [bacterium]
MSLLQTIMAAMSPLEIVAALVSIAGVVLTARQNILTFPVNIVACVLYMKVFADVKLYADSALQLFFISVSCWGWWMWGRGQDAHELPVARTPLATWGVLVALFALGTVVQGYLLHQHTDAAAPYIDSGIFWASVGAQWMVGRKYVENWLVWIAVDSVATILYWSKGLPVTSALYFLFCILAVGGWIAWIRSGRQVASIENRPDGPPIAQP